MSEPFTDGYYRFDDGEASFIGFVHHGVIGDDPVEYYMSDDAPYGTHEIEPVVVLTVADHAALTARIAELEAQADPDALTAAYLRGVSDGKARITELHQEVTELRRQVVAEKEVNLSLVGNMGLAIDRITDLERQLAEARVNGQLWHDRAMTGWKEGDDDVQA